jgi:hypothetical protein
MRGGSGTAVGDGVVVETAVGFGVVVGKSVAVGGTVSVAVGVLLGVAVTNTSTISTTFVGSGLQAANKTVSPIKRKKRFMINSLCNYGLIE